MAGLVDDLMNLMMIPCQMKLVVPLPAATLKLANTNKMMCCFPADS
jgi:hypothetical protein